MTVQSRGQKLATQEFDDFPVVFGRGDDCHLKVKDTTYLSRVHGSVTIEHGEILVSDLNSKNGILLDGKPVPQMRFQGEGRFRVGDLEFECRLHDELTGSTAQIAPLDDDKTSPVIRIAMPSRASDPPLESIPLPRVPPPTPAGPPVQKSRAIRETPPSMPKPTPKVDVAGPARTAVTLDLDIRAQKLKQQDICLQAMITWMGDVFDVRQFHEGDVVRVGPHPTEPIFLPTFLHNIVYGQVKAGRAEMKFSRDTKWRLVEGSVVVHHDDLKSSQQLQINGNQVQLKLERHQILSVNMGQDLEMHLRYVEIPRPLVKRTWIENKEEIKRAVNISAAVHMVVVLAFMLSAPKNHAPKVENVPPRFAKLLVEPPPQIFVPPKVEPPKPPPPPPVVEKKVEPPKVVKKPEPKKPVAQTKPTKAPKTPPKQVAETRTPPKEPPPKSAEDQMADSFASAFSGPPSKSKLDTKDIQVTKSRNTDSNVSPSELMKTLKSQNGRLPSSSGTGAMAANMGQVGYATGGLTGKAGKKDVQGVVVGKPSFNQAAGQQGLTQKEIMKEVNKHVAAIQQCYERALLNNPGLAGRVEFAWTIAPAGGVSGAGVKRSEMTGGEALTGCVINVIEAMKFPVAQNGHSTLATIGFPFGRN